MGAVRAQVQREHGSLGQGKDQSMKPGDETLPEVLEAAEMKVQGAGERFGKEFMGHREPQGPRVWRAELADCLAGHLTLVRCPPLKDPDAGGRADCSRDVEAEGLPCAVQAEDFKPQNTFPIYMVVSWAVGAYPPAAPSEGPELERVAGSLYPVSLQPRPPVLLFM